MGCGGAAGAQIKTENFAGKVHHKFAVIEVEGSDPVVILGSYNWTDSGAYDNDENTLIIHDRDLARAYHAEWQRLWAALREETLCPRSIAYLPMVIREGSQSGTFARLCAHFPFAVCLQRSVVGCR